MSEIVKTTAPAEASAAPRQLILVGSPNVGKSVIFGLLTGQYVTVSNYPGTTVEITRGKPKGLEPVAEVIDTPGILSLNAASEDEVVTRNVIWDSPNPAILQIADAKNLRRNLLITMPLVEMGIPIHLNLNMADEARSRGVKIDLVRLAEILGVAVTETVATRREGVDRLRQKIIVPQISRYHVDYGPEIELSIERIMAFLPDGRISQRSRALTILGSDASVTEPILSTLPPDQIAQIKAERDDCRRRLGGDTLLEISRSRLAAVDQIAREIMSTIGGGSGKWAGYLGRLSMHPIWGVPILAAILFLVYEFVGVFGAGTCVDFLETTIFEGYINPILTSVFSWIGWQFLQDLMVGPYGIFTMAVTYAVAIVFPVVGTFFIIFGILEDSGYLPRLAFMVDRVFRLMGLNGKAVLPMILGLGCDTMATLTSRILETKKERVLVTFLLALGVPCSAQLGFILGMLGGLSYKATLIWAGTIIGILLLVGFLYSQLVKGKRSDFILEVPPIRWPQASNIFIKTFARIEWYLKEAVPLFIVGTLVLFFLDYFKILPQIERVAAPIISTMVGLPQEVTGPFLIGFLRRDYGAAGLFVLARDGKLDPIQIVVSLVIITLFIPCIANFFIIIKERGLKTALAMSAFIFPFAFLVGATLNWILHALGVQL